MEVICELCRSNGWSDNVAESNSLFHTTLEDAIHRHSRTLPSHHTHIHVILNSNFHKLFISNLKINWVKRNCYCRYLPESPRFLLRNRRVKEAHDVLCRMAKMNGRDPISITVLEALRKEEEAATEEINSKKLSYLEFFKHKTLLITSLYLFAIWFSWNVSYYGISYNIRNVPGNIYFNVALIGLANAIGQRISKPISDRYTWVGYVAVGYKKS